MRRLFIIASVWLIGICAAQAGPARYPQTYNDLFTFGMTHDEVAALVDAPLIYLSGARGFFAPCSPGNVVAVTRLSPEFLLL